MLLLLEISFYIIVISKSKGNKLLKALLSHLDLYRARPTKKSDLKGTISLNRYSIKLIAILVVV